MPFLEHVHGFLCEEFQDLDLFSLCCMTWDQKLSSGYCSRPHLFQFRFTEGEDHIEFVFSHGVGMLALGRLPYLGYAIGHLSLASVDRSRWTSLASSFLRPTSSLPQRSSSTSSLCLNRGFCTTLGYVAFTEYEKVGDAM